MKKIIGVSALLFACVIWQGCGSEKREAEQKAIAKAEMESMEKQKAGEAAARKALIVKASAERTVERNRIAAEKAKLSPTYKDASGRIVYYKADVDPTYMGGMEELAKYLKKTLRYPTDARDKGIEGTVFVDFVVDKNGNIREVLATEVVGEDVDASLKEEAVRVVASMSGWTAGRQNGKAVDVAQSVPITFELIK